MIPKTFENHRAEEKMSTLIEYWGNGQPYCIIYRAADLSSLHRDDGPASKRWDASGHPVFESWWRNNKRHRVGYPALVELIWRDDNIIYQRKEWWRDGVQYRESGPAVIEISRAHTREAWYLDGFCYREKIIEVLRAR